MSLNPLTLIENVIVEHGSSVIQGKHLALLKDQLTILKEQLTVSSRQFAELQAENERLATNNANLRQQVEQLTEANQQPRHNRRSETDEKILLQLTDRQQKTSRDIASALGISQDRAEAYLNAMRDEDLVGVRIRASYGFDPPQPALWYLGTDGQHYLVRHELV